MTKIDFGLYINKQDNNGNYIIIPSHKILENFSFYRDDIISMSVLVGEWGRLDISFFDEKLSIDGETLGSLLLNINVKAIEMLMKQERVKCDCQFAEGNYFIFEHTNYGERKGILIKYYSSKDYYDDNGNILFSSEDGIMHEIIIPQEEYFKEIIQCINRFLFIKQMFLNNDELKNIYNEFTEKIVLLKEKFNQYIDNK